MQSRLPFPSSSSTRDVHQQQQQLGLETWDDGTVELRGFPIDDILVVRMVNKMTGETDTSYELHFEYVFDAERVADVLGLAAGPPVEKDEGPGGWRGWVVTVPKRVHHRSQMWERCMERETSRLGERERDRGRDMRERDRSMGGDMARERDRSMGRDMGRERDRSMGRDMGRERDRSRGRDMGRNMRDTRDIRDRDRDPRDFREMDMDGREVDMRGPERDFRPRQVERRSMIPVPIQPPQLKVRKSQRFQ